MPETLLEWIVAAGILISSAVVSQLFTRAMYCRCASCGTLNAKRRVQCRDCGALLL